MLATKKNPHPAAKQRRKFRAPSRLAAIIISITAFFCVNFLVQIYRKPTELLRFAKLGRARTPRQTWSEFEDNFRRNATEIITPDFLAALVQLESSGDTLASPPWTWRWSRNPWEIYGPPSSAVGLLQITKGNYVEASGYCVKNGQAAKDGPWYDPEACKFNRFYSRLVGSHSIEMTAAFLHHYVQKIVGGSRVSLRDKQRLAAVMHLCGPGKGPAFIRAHFDADALGSCGTQSVGAYVRVVMRYRTQFAEMAAAEARPSPSL